MDGIRFRAADGVELVGEIRAADSPAGTAVICHALSSHGGSKDHPILWAIRNDLAGTRGLTVLSFNFRGVMGSGGAFEKGRGEMLDVDAAITRVREEAEGPTFVAGWSFGAQTAMRHAVTDARVAAVALIGIPLGDAGLDLPPLPDRQTLKAYDRPVLIVTGEMDHFCSGPDARSFSRSLGNGEVVLLEGTDHFFARRERELAEMIGEFADRALAAQ